jgi:hypothetical protein
VSATRDRIQHGKAYPNGAAGGRSAVSALAIQLALIVPLKAPAMQVELAADPMELVEEAGHGLLPWAVSSTILLASTMRFRRGVVTQTITQTGAERSEPIRE